MADTKKKDKNKKKVSFKEFNPADYIDLEPTIDEAKNSTIVISFGRMNPVTSGHEKLVNAVLNTAMRKKATPAIYLSHSQDSKKNPLSYDEKITMARRAFGKVIRQSAARTIIEVAKELSGKFNNLVVVVGSDRVREFETLLNKYNGKEFSFDSIEIVSAGERDPDADDVTGMSASKLRKLAADGEFEDFKSGLPTKLKSSAKTVYDKVRDGLGLSEEFDEDLDEELLDERAPLSISQRRRRGLVMKRYKSKIAAARKRARRRKAPPEKLKKRAQRIARDIIRQRLMKGKKYSEMSPAEKVSLDKRLLKVPKAVIDRIAKRQLPTVRRAEMQRLSRELGGGVKKEDFDINEAFSLTFEAKTIKPQDPDVKDMPGSQPKGYYKGVEKSKKDDRARHFRKYAKMDDDNPAAYKPAPGDAEAKTKPSVHTKKFKDMFGENLQEASCADTRVRKRPHMALEKNGSVKFDRRFKMYRPKQGMNESYEDLNEDLVNLMLDMDSFIMSEEFDTLMESNPTEALKKKAEKSGISYGILKKVFDRGVAAWRTGHRPGTTPTQWGLARVNSFATKGKGTWGKADSDLAAKVRKEEFELDEKAPGILRKMVLKHKLNKGIRKTAADRDAMVRSGKTWPEMEKEYDKSLAKRDSMKKALARLDKKEEVELDNDIFTLDEMFEMQYLDEAVAIDKVLDKMHKYVQNGIDLGDIAYDISNMVSGIGSGRQLEKKYIEKYGEPKKTRTPNKAVISRLKSKYGLKESDAVDAAKERIKAEKEADKRRHDRMLSRAIRRDAQSKISSIKKEEVDKEDPKNREYGTDSLVKILKGDTPGENLKEQSPYMKDLPKGCRVSFKKESMTDSDYSSEGTVVGTDPSTMRLRVRDDDGRLYVVKHEDVSRIDE